MSATLPDVPNTPGVPAVNRAAGATTATEPKLQADSILVTGAAKDQWGIYTSDGAKVLDADSVMSIGFEAESRVADFPVEQGGFESYDKVALPFGARVVMTKGGSLADRRDFVAKLDEVRTDLNLYNVITPERTYLGANITRVSIDRSREQGANLITAEVILQEIRQTVIATFTASQQPSGADTRNNGIVQAKPADTATQQVVAAKSAAITPTGAKPFFAPNIGQTLMTIATAASVPSQTLAVQLAGKAVGITLGQKATGLFADVFLGGKPIVTGVLVRDAVRIINGAHLGFPGDLAVVDTQGATDPSFDGLGDRFQLLWAS